MLTQLGATLCAITPQPPEASRPLIEKHKISFDLLSDGGNEYAAKLGLRFKLPDDLKQVYLSFGNDLAMRNGEELDPANAGPVRHRPGGHRARGRCRS